jgi:outer membrane immunogenic protein
MRGHLIGKKAGISLLSTLSFTSLLTFAQQNRFDVMLGATAAFSKSSTGNGTTDAPTNSGGFLATVRYRFSAKNAVELNYGSARNSQIYTSSPNTFRIQNRATEFTGAYVFTPFETKKAEPFVFGGVGLLSFNPDNTFVDGVQTPIPADRRTQIAFLYGGGLDYRIFSSVPLIRRSPASEHLALRLQYRGLVYKTPDFNISGLFTGAYGHMAEPSAGIVIKF